MIQRKKDSLEDILFVCVCIIIIIISIILVCLHYVCCFYVYTVLFYL